MHVFGQEQVKKGEEGGSNETDQENVRKSPHKTQQVFSLSLTQCGGFYALLPDGLSGSISYMAKAVVNRLLQQGLSYDTSKQCCIS